MESEQKIVSPAGYYTCVAAPASGSHAVLGDSTGAVSIWNLNTQRPQPEIVLRKHTLGTASDRNNTESINCVALNEDGLRAITGDQHDMARFWDINAGRLLCAFKKDGCMVNAVALTPDGNRAFICRADGTIQTWDQVTGKKYILPINTSSYQKLKSRPSTMTLIPPEKALLIGTIDGNARLFDLTANKYSTTFEHEDGSAAHEGRVHAQAISPDMTTATTCGFDNIVHTWDLCTAKHICSHRLMGLCAAYLAYTKRAVVGGTSTELQVIDPITGLESEHKTPHVTWLTGIAALPADRCVTTAFDGAAYSTQIPS